MVTTLDDIRTPRADDPWDLTGDLRNFAQSISWHDFEFQGVTSRCRGCGSSDFRDNRCMFCRRIR